MDMGLREWLVIILLLVIAGILFDGWRRMRGGSGRLKFKLDKNIANMPDDDGGDAELLSEPRVVKSAEKVAEQELDELLVLPSMSARESVPSRKRQVEPAQGDLALDLDEPEPLLGEASEPAAQKAEKTNTQPVEEVLVINIVSRDEGGFKGPALLQNILESGLRFGQMDIFHRHESMAGNGEVLFSMANGVKPGTFDLDDMELFTTRAVSFFLSLPGPRHPKQAFDVMVAAARKLAHELDGELKDDQRSVLTAQTIEHYRLRIAEFERKQLTHKR